jgi:hypothetical protein
MLEIRIGFTIFRVKRPRSIDEDAFSWDVPRRVEKSTTRRKTTDSVRVIERVFFCDLELAVILQAGRSFVGRSARFRLVAYAYITGPDLQRSEK